MLCEGCGTRQWTDGGYVEDDCCVGVKLHVINTHVYRAFGIVAQTMKNIVSHSAKQSECRGPSRLFWPELSTVNGTSFKKYRNNHLTQGAITHSPEGEGTAYISANLMTRITLMDCNRCRARAKTKPLGFFAGGGLVRHFSFSAANKYLSPERRGESVWGSELPNARRAPTRRRRMETNYETKVQPRVTSDKYRVSVDVTHNTSTQNDNTFVFFLGCLITLSQMFPMFLLESRRQISFFFFFFLSAQCFNCVLFKATTADCDVWLILEAPVDRSGSVSTLKTTKYTVRNNIMKRKIYSTASFQLLTVTSPGKI